MRRADGESRPKEKGERAALSVLPSCVGQVKQRLKTASRLVRHSAAGQATQGATWHPSNIPAWQKPPAWCEVVSWWAACGEVSPQYGGKRNAGPRVYLQQLGRDLGISHSLHDQC